MTSDRVARHLAVADAAHDDQLVVLEDAVEDLYYTIIYYTTHYDYCYYHNYYAIFVCSATLFYVSWFVFRYVWFICFYFYVYYVVNY